MSVDNQSEDLLKSRRLMIPTASESDPVGALINIRGSVIRGVKSCIWLDLKASVKII